ncbi:MAG: protease modulator HflC, partial [Verrucomicrobiota bacterium]
GLHFKLPFIQEANSIEKRIQEWDGKAIDMPTKDKVYLSVDTFGRWKIKDPLKYFLRLNEKRRAFSRLEDILGSETRSAVAKHELIEIIRSTKDRVPVQDKTLSVTDAEFGKLLPITKGRHKIEREILEAAKGKLSEFGIQLLDIRFKRVNYTKKVLPQIYDRMISERKQIAERFRSEGQGEAARIQGTKEKDLQRIESEAYKKIQTIRGEADAKSTEIYAQAYNQSAEAIEFYEFMKTLETYTKIIDKDTTMILSTQSDLFKLFKGIEEAPAQNP